MSGRRLTHVDEAGRARMVDVGTKDTSERVAQARARVHMSPDSARAVEAGNAPKGEVLAVARLAGIQAAKQTALLIPLAHPLGLTLVDVSASVDVEAGMVELLSEVRTVARTGVEMEAMTACAVAALTVYDMTKALERGIEIREIVLLEKRGGRSDWRRADEDAERGERRGEEGSSMARAGTAEDTGPGPRTAIITISTSKATGSGEDQSGARLDGLAARLGAQIVGREVISDDRSLIEERLRHWAEAGGCALVLTTGGTGLAPSDVTPEATAAVIDREVPGITEAMRVASRPHTPHWMLSRGLAGIRGATLIVNFPGSPASIDQVGEVLIDSLPHAIELIEGRDPRH
ncbi:MAG: molybdenum cofactor biosynthesis protein [Solirubrobacterales bacterium]|nr:molybdenum cofactor biosynthesis protein [Solirubrobacterales bacterium]